MRKIAMIGIVVAVAAISASWVTAGHRSHDAQISSIDPTALTQKAGMLPVVQVDEPF